MEKKCCFFCLKKFIKKNPIGDPNQNPIGDPNQNPNKIRGKEKKDDNGVGRRRKR